MGDNKPPLFMSRQVAFFVSLHRRSLSGKERRRKKGK